MSHWQDNLQKPVFVAPLYIYIYIYIYKPTSSATCIQKGIECVVSTRQGCPTLHNIIGQIDILSEILPNLNVDQPVRS